MSNTTQVLIVVELPDDLLAKYFQHIRDFDTAHTSLNFEFGISARKDGEVIDPPSLPSGH